MKKEDIKTFEKTILDLEDKYEKFRALPNDFFYYRLAAINFANQFIDLASEEAIDMKYEVYLIEKNSGLRQRVWNSVYATPKQSILNIKDLIR
jgi:hypothetical protein